MTYLYFHEHESAPYAQGVQEALATLEAKAVFEGPERPVFVRVAEVDGAIYLDLANDDWQVVKVTSQGWELIEGDTAPVRFRRPRGMSPIPVVPVRGGVLAELANLLNVETDSRDWKLIVAWLLQALRGAGPYPVLVLTGGQGSGKSTSAKLLRALLDPNVSPLRSLPRDERDLFIAATNSWVPTFDNISGLSQSISDALCRLATGGGLSVRELFSDADETLLDAMRPVALNGITDFVDKQDLVDRALQVHLPSIPKHERKPEKVLWERFSEAQPRVLGALLDTVVVGLQHLPSTTLGSLPRLADFALWATACEQPLGWQQGEFMAAYQDAQDDLIKDALEAEPVAVHLLSFVKGYKQWTGTASELLAALTAHAFEDKRTPKGWPGAAHVLAGTLKRIAPALLAQGIEVVSLDRDGKSRVKQWQIRTVEENKRSERSDLPQDVRNDVQDSASTANVNTNASSTTGASGVHAPDRAFTAEQRDGQHASTLNAPNASNSSSSNENAPDIPNGHGGEDL